MSVQRPVALESIRYVGTGLKRPECVAAGKDGTIYVSHLGAGLMKIAPDGSQTVLGSTALVDGTPWIPNGFALLDDGGFLIANMGEAGGLWKMDTGGNLNPVLREVDGIPLTATNFVFRDREGRIWLTVSTRQWPISRSFNRTGGRTSADGYIVLLDNKGPRIVADGLAFANELRFGPNGHHLYVAETMGSRISRFAVRPGGHLVDRESFVDFGASAFPDGLAFDEAGFLWTASLISNQVLRVAPDGGSAVVLEESNPAHVDQIVSKMNDGSIAREDMQTTPARILRNISSLCFGGADRRTVYIGSLGGDRLVSFRSDVPGAQG